MVEGGYQSVSLHMSVAVNSEVFHVTLYSPCESFQQFYSVFSLFLVVLL